jgi:hypothetical protein
VVDTRNQWKEETLGLLSPPLCRTSIARGSFFLNTFICPANSGLNYFCYKNYFSIVFLAIVDPCYKFIVVDIGSYGRYSDSGIFQNLAFYQEYIDGKIILPPKPLPGTNIPVPHVLIGDEGFALQTYLMHCFPRAAIANDARKKGSINNLVKQGVSSKICLEY